MIKLDEKRILITGASSGIGREAVRLSDKLGAKTIITSRNKDKLSSLSSELSNECQIIPADLTSNNDIQNLIDSIQNVDGVVHCAGKVFPYPVKYLKQKQIDDVFKTNLFSAIELSSQLFTLKKINDGASLVFISSISVKHPYMGGALYSSSKAAIESFSKTIALEYSNKRIRSNCIAPALVETEILESTKKAYSKEEWQSIVQQYPLGVGEPMDVANLIAFLLSDSSKWMTGNTIPIDGGLVLNSKR